MRAIGKDFNPEAAANFEVRTESSLGSYGRVDIQLKSNEWLVLIENKFYAGFSGGNQIEQYAQYLSRNNKQKKALVLLCPKERGQYYLSLIETQLRTETDYGSSSIQRIESFLNKSGIKFVLLPWELLLNDFRSGNNLVNNLHTFISNRYLKDTTLNEEELEVLNGTTVPDLLEKLWGGVDKVKDALSLDFAVKRTSQSRLFYGFFIEENWGQVWIGLYTNA